MPRSACDSLSVVGQTRDGDGSLTPRALRVRLRRREAARALEAGLRRDGRRVLGLRETRKGGDRPRGQQAISVEVAGRDLADYDRILGMTGDDLAEVA